MRVTDIFWSSVLCSAEIAEIILADLASTPADYRFDTVSVYVSHY